MSEYATIKKWLNHGEINMIAEENGISRQQLWRVLTGKSKNFELFQACYDKAIENAMRQKASNEKLLSV